MKINIRLQSAACAAFALGLSLLPLHARANGLIGSSVTGSLYFSGNPDNYFDPANGYVPSSGYENTSGTTVTISAPAVEFGFADSSNTDLANFSAMQFTLEDVLSSTAGGSDNPWTMTFTDTAFTGMSFAQVSDFFPNGGLTGSLTGDVFTASWAGGPIHANDDYTSTFTVALVPEPATSAAVLVGAAGLALVLRRKGRAAALRS
jgi:hypothetical protein